MISVKRTKTFTLVSIFIILMTSFSIVQALGLFHSSTFLAKNGKISLQNWNAEKQDIVELDGEWDFYPNKLITPSPNEDVFKNDEHIHKLIHVPEAWDDYIAETPTPYGVGTYRLRITVPEDDRYGIKLNTIRNANKIYVNGIELGSAGAPSTSKEAYRFDFKKYVVIEKSKAKQLDVVILVANQEYATGGIVNSIEFGKANQILAKKGLAQFIEAFLISGHLLFAFIYLTTYFQHQKKYTYELYFSLFCLFQALHVSTVNERWIYLLFPNMSPTIQVEIQAIGLSLSVLFFLLFVYHFFNTAASKRVVTILSGTLALQTFVVALLMPIDNPFQYIPFQLIQLVISLTTAAGYIYIFMILLKAFKQKTDETKYVQIVVLSFTSYGLLLGIVLLFEVEIGSPSLALFLIMAMSLSLLMSYRSQQAFHRVEELSEELLVYDRLKDEFLAKTSHELGTPLHGIINLSQSLMEGVEGPLKKQQQESIILINTVGKRLASLVKDLLFVSKIKQGETQMAPKPINIHLVEEVLAEMSYIIPPTQSVQLINDIPSELPLVYVDEQKLKQVFFNLLYNAIKFTKHGTITISAKIVDEQMHISVQDTGSGIEKEHLDFIFTTFYQVKSSKFGESAGLGLGLSITKQIVEESGGRIWVASEIGKGSCFTFTIPLANEQQLLELDETERSEISKQANSIRIKELKKQTLQPTLPTKVTGTKPYTILVVDDEVSNLKVLMNIIQSLDYSVIAVGNGQEALEILESEQVDLLILDLMMPNMTGYEVCKIIRQNYDLVELPVIILTAAGQLSDLVTSFQLGANDFLQKPVNMEELKARVESLLLMKKSAQDALHHELNYSYAQITPHFLYNTLNTIIGLSYSDEEKTREALGHLATYFRAKLDFRNQHSLVPLEDEIELIEAYLAIEQIRFGDRLRIEYDIDHTIDTYIPSMSLQPLVENAVQHGISKNKDGGILRMTIEREMQNVKMTIEDNGIGISETRQQELLSNKTGRLGFTNPFKKLTLIKGTSFQLKSEEGEGTKITIRMPKVKNNGDIVN